MTVIDMDPLAEVGQLRIEYWRVDVIRRGVNHSHLGVVLNSTAGMSMSAGPSSTCVSQLCTFEIRLCFLQRHCCPVESLGTLRDKEGHVRPHSPIRIPSARYASFIQAYTSHLNSALDVLQRNGIAPLVSTAQLIPSPAVQRPPGLMSHNDKQPAAPPFPGPDRLTAFAVSVKYEPYYTQTTLRSDSSQMSARTIDDDAPGPSSVSEVGEEAMDSDEEEMRQLKVRGPSSLLLNSEYV